MNFRLYYGSEEQDREAMRVPVGGEYRHIVSAYKGNKLAYLIKEPNTLIKSISGKGVQYNWTAPYDCLVFGTTAGSGDNDGGVISVVSNGVSIIKVRTYQSWAAFNFIRVKRGDIVSLATGSPGVVQLFFIGDIECRAFVKKKNETVFSEIDYNNTNGIHGLITGPYIYGRDSYRVETKYGEVIFAS